MDDLLTLQKISKVIYPVNFEEKIKFNRIRDLLKESCASVLGQEYVDSMDFTLSFEKMTLRLHQTNEFLRILQEEQNFPASFFIDVREPLKKIRVEGLFLDERELFDLRRSLASIRDIVRFFVSKSDEEYPNLRKLSANVIIYPSIIDRIDQILNKFGKIKDNASSELASIRKDIQAQQASISRKMQTILRHARAEGIVDPDATVSIRDGRAVIPVPSGNKRKLGGIIHDESATGKTSFIEPAEIVEINNQLRELEYAERRELARILMAMSDEIRPHLSDLFYAYEFLGIVDFIRAKARFALRIGAVLPHVRQTTEMRWDNAVHPLLFLQHQASGQSVVPLNIELEPENRILIISGPNAGGKSVCLQTVGLLQYMLQCGLLVPMAEWSKMGFFNQVFMDMGDEQSLENDLSTYSSHLLNMKNFVRNATDKTLILIDEFGTGTEPMLGGSIAEAVLSHLNKIGVYGVITTHYTNLKHFASQTSGLINGAMQFDTHAIQPLFKLEMGKPGSSFAFEIARKIGLPESILIDAQALIGQDNIDFDKHLREIVRDKRYWEQKRQTIRINEKRLDEVLATYQDELEKVKKEKKEIIRKAKLEASDLMVNANKQIENTIREIRENQADKEKTLVLRQSMSALKQEIDASDDDRDDHIERKINKIKDRENRKHEKVPEDGLVKKSANASKPIAVDNSPLTIGNHVKLDEQDLPGIILSIDGKNATVAFGNLKTTLKINRLTRITKNTFKKESRNYDESYVSAVSERVRQSKLSFKPDIDIRGKRADEAIQMVLDYLDEALVCEVHHVKILHGKGDGILRKLIREQLAAMTFIKSFRDEHVQFGGSGITLVDLDI